METTSTPLLDLLASYDQEVEAAFAETLEVSTGTEKVQLLYRLRHMIALHDAVLAGVLCPMLSSMPQGREVADHLREGCNERGKLLQRFQMLSIGVAARNVYAASGPEVERILTELRSSFRRHSEIETVEVVRALESSGASTDPGVLAARMDLEVRRAPTFAHRRVPRSGLLKAVYRYVDRYREWVDAHHGWKYMSAARREERPDQYATAAASQAETTARERWVPREPEPVRHGLSPPAAPRPHVWDEVGPRPPWLRGNGTVPSIGEVLESYDRAVDKIIDELQAAKTVSEHVESLRRLETAISIHDSVLSGTLCPLLRSLPGGEPFADRYEQGATVRVELSKKLDEILAVRPDALDAYREHADAVEDPVEQLLASFRHHERDESPRVTEFLSGLPKTPATPSELTTASGDRVGPWPSTDPATIATVMALYAERAPARNR